MSQRYTTNGHGYANALHNSQDHQRSTFNPTLNDLPNTSYPQPLPPLSAPNTDFPSSRIQQLPPSQPQPSTLHYTQASPTYPIYAPTSNIHFSDDFVPNTQAQQRPQYTHAAPPNLQLPKIQPAPTGNGDPKIKKEVLQPLASAPAASGPEVTPKHVVGSQGRRGILPSASGRPPAIITPGANGGKTSPALNKDAEGKYPCPHCNKPYLHAKHLKRHMLRHTGVRPYECALCHDTFSRSDILKRHFQKCSVRRGNPTGESHLAYSRANKKARQQNEEEQMLALTTEQGTLSTYSTSLESPIGLAGMDLPHPYDNKQAPLANQVTRSNGIRMMGSHRGSTSSLNFDTFSTGHVTPDSVTTSGAATPYTFPHERSALNSPADATFNQLGLNSRYSSAYSNGSLPHILGNRSHDIDWSSFAAFSGPPEDFNANTTYHSGTSTPHNYKHDENPDFTNFPWLSSGEQQR